MIGALRPVILLPASLASGLTAAQLESILLHELAHVRRHDYLVNLLQAAVETLLFYHPAAWWASRRIRAEREHCCDDAVVAVTGDRATYARALAAVAELATQFGAGAPALAPAATGGRLLARIRRLMTPAPAPDAHLPRRTGAAVALCLGIVAAVGLTGVGAGAAGEKATAPLAAAPVAPPAEPAAPPAAEKRTLDFMLVDKTSGGPIKTSLRVRADSDRWQVETDAEGRCRIEYPAKAKYLQVFADHPAYVPTRAQFYDELGNEPPPETYALAVERGTLIGGTVVDEAGKPIEGATVNMDFFPPQGFVPKAREEFYLIHVNAPTDARGHWLFPRAPKDFALNVRLIHPEYISDVAPRFETTPPVAKLHDTTAVIVMKKGVALAGRVVDAETGKPVAGAEVAQGEDRWGNDYPVTRTGDDGRFRFGGCRPGAMVLTVVAAGYAPDLRDVNVAEGAGDVEFKLASGRVLRGRVVDKGGKPVAGATVGADTWRRRRSLMWKTETDLDGRFVWNEAPPDEVLGYLGAGGFAMVRNLPLVAGDAEKEQVFTLARSLKVSGVVTDAETARPVEQFTVIRGTFFKDNPVRWDRERTQAVGRGGKFEYEVTEASESQAVRVEAEGYAPMESRRFTPTAEEDSVSLDFALKKSRGLSGVVRAPDGTPAVAAQLALATPGRLLYVRNGRLPASSVGEAASTTTDDFGRYRFPEQTGPFTLVAVHDAGYAEVPGAALDKSGDVKLTAWATIRGTVRVGSKPAAGQAIEIDPDPQTESPDDRKAPAVTFRSWATADDAGRFAFDRVPAGLVYVARTVALGGGLSTSSHRVAVYLTPGRQADVQVGGTGRPVIGRVAFAPGVKARPWAIESSSIDTKRVDEPKQPPEPAAGEKMSEYDRESRNRQIRQWAQEIDLLRRSYQHFPLLLDKADGTFRVDDVPPGRYELRVSVAASGTPKYEHLGGLTREFTVPPVPGGQSDEPVDLGTLTVEPAGTK